MPAEGQLILSVDDEESFREIVKTVLEAGGFRVEEAKDGIEALKKAKDLRPSLILLDMKMPGMTGADVLGRLQEIEEIKNTPVVFLTSFGDPRVEFSSDEHFSKEVGAQDFVSKSRLAQDLLPKVKEVLQNG